MIRKKTSFSVRLLLSAFISLLLADLCVAHPASRRYGDVTVYSDSEGRSDDMAREIVKLLITGPDLIEDVLIGYDADMKMNYFSFFGNTLFQDFQVTVESLSEKSVTNAVVAYRIIRNLQKNPGTDLNQAVNNARNEFIRMLPVDAPPQEDRLYPDNQIGMGLEIRANIPDFHQKDRGDEIDDEEGLCQICYAEQIPDDELKIRTKCGKRYCKKCLEEWIAKNHTCPICGDREKIEKASIDQPHFKAQKEPEIKKREERVHPPHNIPLQPNNVIFEGVEPFEIQAAHRSLLQRILYCFF